MDLANVFKNPESGLIGAEGKYLYNLLSIII
jgi:hypothetical protein